MHHFEYLGQLGITGYARCAKSDVCKNGHALFVVRCSSKRSHSCTAPGVQHACRLGRKEVFLHVFHNLVQLLTQIIFVLISDAKRPVANIPSVLPVIKYERVFLCFDYTLKTMPSPRLPYAELGFGSDVNIVLRFVFCFFFLKKKKVTRCSAYSFCNFFKMPFLRFNFSIFIFCLCSGILFLIRGICPSTLLFP